MNYKIKKVFLIACIVLVNIIILSGVVLRENETEQQEKLYIQAQEKVEDKIYIKAVPLLEKAISIKTDKTKEIEEFTKDVYLNLSNQRVYQSKYIDLCLIQIYRDNDVDVYNELSTYYFAIGEQEEALDLLNRGITATNNEQLKVLFEQNRYNYSLSRYIYDDVTVNYMSTIGVMTDGKWGLANNSGKLIIPCIYEKISTYENMGKGESIVVVEKDGEIYAVDSQNNRVALLKEDALDFGNLSQGLIPIKVDNKWKVANTDLMVYTLEFDELNTFKNGYASAKSNDKWGFISTNGEWFIEPIYDSILTDDLGRSYSQKSFFVKSGDKIKLISNGVELETEYEDARPFNNYYYAAVKKNGKWGFINNDGEVVIDYEFDDALSFSDGLAAVKVKEKWGYINVNGDIVIEPVFLYAKSFSNGSAPVKTIDAWRILNLEYYK